MIEFEFFDDLRTIIIDSKTLKNAGDKQDKQHVEFHILSGIFFSFDWALILRKLRTKAERTMHRIGKHNKFSFNLI